MHERLTSLPALIAYWTLLSLLVMMPYVFFDMLIVPGADTIAYYYPNMYWFADVLARGDSFLWDPQIFSGFPSYLSQVSGYIEPLNLFLFSTLPFLFAYHLRLIIDYVLTMLVSYLAARHFGISKLAAFFVGPLYLIAFHWWYLSNTVIANSLFLMPFLFWVYLSSRKSPTLARRIAWGLFGGIGVGWAFLGGYAQFVVYALTFVGLLAVTDFWVLSGERTARRAIEQIGVLALFALGGVVVGAPAILASIAYVPFSVRSGGLEYALTQIKVLEPQELIYLFFPDYLRFPLLTGGKKTLFIGTLFLATALIAILHLRRTRIIPIFFGLFAFAFILSLPGSPLYYLLHQLPVFELFRYPYRWMYLGIWMLVMLGAIGFDMLRDGPFDRRTRYVALGLGTIASGLVVFTLFTTFVGEWFWGTVKEVGVWLFSHFVYGESFGKGLEHYAGAISRGVDAWREVASLTNIQYVIPFLSIVGSSAVLLARVYEKITVRAFERLAVLVLVATFVGVFVARWPDSLPSSVFDEHHRTAGDAIPPADFGLYRVHPFNLGESFAERVPPTLAWNTENVLAGVEVQFATGGPNDHRFAGYNLTDGYDPFVARDLVHVLAFLGGNYASEDLVSGVPLPERKDRLTSRLDILGMMGGKYVIAGGELVHPDLHLIAIPTASRYNVPYYIYEYSKALPRIRYALKTESLPHATVMELIEAGKEFTVTYLDCAACATSGSRRSTFDIRESANGYFDITIDAEADEWLIVSEQFLPGWRAELDREVIEPVRANGMYMAFKIPEGEHELVLQYEGIRGEARWLYKLGLFPRPPLGE